MHPIHDVDPLILLAIALASKRRPAELVEFMAAIDLLQQNIPAEAKLAEAISRLAAHGLVVGHDDRLALSPEAQQLVEAVPHKAETAERLFSLRDSLSMHRAPGEHAPVNISPEALRAAMLAHRAAGQSTAKNLLVPKPKPVEPAARPGQRQRKPLPARRKKT